MADDANGAVTGGMLDCLETYSFNTPGCLSTEETIEGLFVSYTKRLRDDMGVKFQTVLYNKAADYEGVINLKNSTQGEQETAQVYWLTGVSAGRAINKSNINSIVSTTADKNEDFQMNQIIRALDQIGNDIAVLFNTKYLGKVQ